MKTIGVVGYSGSGKTSLLCALIPLLQAKGLRIAVVKSTHHEVDWDTPGKDSYRLREAGAEAVLLQGPQRWFTTFRAPETADLESMTAALPSSADLLFLEGNKGLPIPKIEVHRPSLQKPLLALEDSQIIAVASDTALSTHCPVVDLNSPQKIAEFIYSWIHEEP
ncbi:molybdopterin-guanine dinucleotide biosynthesis protein B [Acidithiobacillus marinus]|uniref:Molybdopterin-guanine dinucleotide biosynthesis protein B n=1 Tax=Acidithiobacillus marinus TaxID=187490 RepID=A0A2I1DKS6_9PROT|nr:molybdopterin-guanine dinucleotide biosynthesis protein B [Acidithiobacillus marinus]PKY10488.1 molybdopterin-guanine dinucleotide biosynthesis protein B [Acidithiobacillus marinus]